MEICRGERYICTSKEIGKSQSCHTADKKDVTAIHQKFLLTIFCNISIISVWLKMIDPFVLASVLSPGQLI